MKTTTPRQWSRAAEIHCRLIRSYCDLRAEDLSALPQEDWREVQSQAIRHRTINLVAANLQEVLPEANRPSTADAILETARKLTLSALKRAHGTREVASKFNEVGIDAFLLKSEAVSQRFYKDAFHRHSKDIDYLVRFDDLQHAFSALRDLGYEQSYPEFEVPHNNMGMIDAILAYVEFCHPQTGQCVELHWRLFKNPALMELDFGREWDRREYVTIGGQPIATLCKPVQLVYMLAHGAVHCWFRLKWVADIDRMLTIMTEDELAQAQSIAERSDLGHVFQTGLLLRHMVFEQGSFQNLIENYSERELMRTVDYAFARMKATDFPYEQRFSNVPKIFSQQAYLFGLVPTSRYKRWTVINLFTLINDVKRFGLPRKYLWVYVALAPVTGSLRMVRNMFRRPSH